MLNIHGWKKIADDVPIKIKSKYMSKVYREEMAVKKKTKVDTCICILYIQVCEYSRESCVHAHLRVPCRWWIDDPVPGDFVS